MLHIAICDDEELCVNQLKELVFNYGELNNLPIKITTFFSGVDLLKAPLRYELIFLDIDMPGLSGLETAKRIRESNMISKIVYVTNHPNFTRQALSVHSFGYCVKPIRLREINSLLDDFVRSIENVKRRNTVTFQSAKSVICLDPEEILYFEYHGNPAVKIFTVDNEIIIHYTLQDVLRQMERYGFAMPHKSFIVNLFYVKSIKGFDILMSNGTVLPIAQKRSSSFREIHNAFLQRGI